LRVATRASPDELLEEEEDEEAGVAVFAVDSTGAAGRGAENSRGWDSRALRLGRSTGAGAGRSTASGTMLNVKGGFLVAVRPPPLELLPDDDPLELPPLLLEPEEPDDPDELDPPSPRRDAVRPDEELVVALPALVPPGL